MRKGMYITSFIIIFVIAICIGVYLFYKNDNKQTKTEIQNNISNELTIQENTNNIQNDIIVSIVEEEKISPNAVITFKKHYLTCDHIIKEYSKIPEELVNLTKEELQKHYEGWEIESFSTNEIVLIKQIDDVCNEHYVLRLKNGTIAVYKIEKDNSEVLKQETGIGAEYLTISDQAKLEVGIEIYGKEKLNSVLEDYE